MKIADVTIEKLEAMGYKGFCRNPQRFASQRMDFSRALSNVIEAAHLRMELDFGNIDIRQCVRVMVLDLQEPSWSEWIERPYTEQEKVDSALRLASMGMVLVENEAIA